MKHLPKLCLFCLVATRPYYKGCSSYVCEKCDARFHYANDERMTGYYFNLEYQNHIFTAFVDLNPDCCRIKKAGSNFEMNFDFIPKDLTPSTFELKLKSWLVFS